jgi:tetratricopeptide (TPR) repeat protein
MRKLNRVFLACLILVLGVTAGTIHVLHQYQVRRNVSVLLDRARRAEAANQKGKALESLTRYLAIRRNDGPTWLWYARLRDETTPPGRLREEVYQIHLEALGYNPGNLTLLRKCADLALEVQRYGEARGFLKNVYKNAPRDAQGEPTDAELEVLLGRCDEAERKFASVEGGRNEEHGEGAEYWYRTAIEHDPKQVDAYDRLARILRTELRRNEEADAQIDAMVKANPESARAHLNRWKYRSRFFGDADPADVEQALRLDPDDLEVLLAGSVIRERKKDMQAAREFLLKGQKLAPKNILFPLALSNLDEADGHPERAADVLRAAAQSNPNPELWYYLADFLITQDKPEAAAEAQLCVKRLRDGGAPEGYVQSLEARLLFRKEQWPAAISKINTARALLAKEPAMLTRLNLLLAECYRRMGDSASRMAALEEARKEETTGTLAGLTLARELVRSGKMDDAIAIHLQLADRRPESRLDAVKLLIEKALRLPLGQRDLRVAELQLEQAEKSLTGQAEEVGLLRCELLSAVGRFDEARRMVEAAQLKDSRNVRYRVALAAIARAQGNAPLAVQILQQAEKDLGPSLVSRLALIASWVSQGGDEARSAIPELAKSRTQIRETDQPTLLRSLAQAAFRLGDVPLARDCLGTLMALLPKDVEVMMELFDLELQTDRLDQARKLVDDMRAVEGDDGALWRYGEALYLIAQARRGDKRGLTNARNLASDVASRRRDWWGGVLLQGEIAELEGNLKDATDGYFRAIELGNSNPGLARRLVGLLNQFELSDQIDRLAQILKDRGLAVEDLTGVMALNAIRQKDFEKGVALARRAFPESSRRATDHLFLGQLLFSAGRSEEAEREFERAVELGRELPDAWLAWVRYLVQGKQTDRAKTVVEAAGKALPADRATVPLAQCYMLVGDAGQAEMLFEKALKASPSDPPTLRAAAAFYLSLKRNDRARELLTRLADLGNIEAGKDIAWARTTLSLMQIGDGASRLAGINQALEVIKQNLRENPYDLDNQRLKALLLSLRTSQRQDAIREFELLAAKNQLGPDGRFVLATLYSAEGRTEEYRAQMLQIVRDKKRNPRYLAQFIGFLIAGNDLAAARQWLGELESQEPESLAAMELNSAMLKKEMRDQDLLKFLQDRIKQNPDRVGDVALLLDRHGFATQAEQSYRADVDRVPRKPERVLTLASFLARHGRIDEAMTIVGQAWKTCPLERVSFLAMGIYDLPATNAAQRSHIEVWIAQAVQNQPGSSDLLTKLAGIRQRQQRFEEAESLLRKALTANAEDIRALNDLAWLVCQRRPDGLKDALELVDRAIDVAGEDPALLDTRAVVLMKLGKLSSAKQTLEKSLTLRPSSRAGHLHLAMVLLADDKAASRQALQKAEELGLTLETVDRLELKAYQALRDDLAQH